MIRLLTILSLVLVSLTAFSPVITYQPNNTQAKFRALYIYQIATLVDWPAQYKNGSFIIGVFGDDKVYDELVKSHGSKTVGSQPLKLLKFNSVEEVSKCHVLYIAPDKNNHSAELIKKYKSSSTLFATESAGMLKSGAVVNFLIHNNKVAFELSKANAAKYNLVVTSTVMNYAVNKE